MNTLFKNRTSIGTIIARMQVPYLTESHRNMIKTIQNRHQRVVILLGVSTEVSKSNIFPFGFRRQMILPLLRVHDVILPLLDSKDDNKVWVERVDNLISALLSPSESAILYGGRDSFIPYYKKDGGVFETQELLPEDNDSGTELRSIASTKPPIYSKETAEAMLWQYEQLQSAGLLVAPNKKPKKK